MKNKRNVEVCFTPELLFGYSDTSAIVVIIDIFRATSSICTAFANGVSSLIPVAEVEEARVFKEKGFTVAGERDGTMLEFADFGNSPDNFSAENVAGKTVVYTTTNGTRTIKMASEYSEVLIGSFLNASALIEYLIRSGKNILLLCAGWKGKFNLEDSVCAGYLASRLIESGEVATTCDSAHAAMDLWAEAGGDLRKYIDKAAHRHRLKAKNLDYCIDYCLTIDVTRVIPVLKDGILVSNSSDKG